MEDTRTFSAADKSSNDVQSVKGKLLLLLLLSMCALQRKKLMTPVTVTMNEMVYNEMCVYLSNGRPIDTVIGIKVLVDKKEGAMPFVLYSVGRG